MEIKEKDWTLNYRSQSDKVEYFERYFNHKDALERLKELQLLDEKLSASIVPTKDCKATEPIIRYKLN